MKYPRVSKPADISVDKALQKKPTLSAKTIEYAEKRRYKMQTSDCDVVEQLYRKNTMMQEKKKMRANDIKQAEEIDEEATFRPKTLNYEGQAQPTHGDKCLDLYSKVKPGQYAKRNIQEPDAEFEKQKNDCSFKPIINDLGCHLAKPDQTLDEIKGAKEKIKLIAQGRMNQKQISAT